MVIKRILCIFLAVLSLVTLIGCGDKKDETKNPTTSKPVTVTAKNEINLLYCKSDSFNPYTAVSNINRDLSNLLFEPLVKTDNDTR